MKKTTRRAGTAQASAKTLFADHSPDLDCDPRCYQNQVVILGHSLTLQRISSESVQNFLSNLVDKQMNRQTNRLT